MTDARTIPACPVCGRDCTDTIAHALAVFDRAAERRNERAEVVDFLVWPDDPRWSLSEPMAVAA